MYARSGWGKDGGVPPNYGGCAIREEDEGYIEEKRNPWESPPKAEEGGGAFSVLRGMLPALGLGKNFAPFLPFLKGGGLSPQREEHTAEENLVLLAVAVFLLVCPKGDKRTALLLLLVYFLA